MKANIGTIMQIVSLGQRASKVLINGGMPVADQVNLGFDLQRALIRLSTEIGNTEVQIEDTREDIHSIKDAA